MNFKDYGSIFNHLILQKGISGLSCVDIIIIKY
jgi:hypothetical protein